MVEIDGKTSRLFFHTIPIYIENLKRKKIYQGCDVTRTQIYVNTDEGGF